MKITTIPRQLETDIRKNWDSGKVIIVLGPRQVGKTTLLTALCAAQGNYLELNGDNPEHRLLFANWDTERLRRLFGNYETVFIDEAQRIPEVGLIAKVVHDQMPIVRLLLSGSSALEIAGQINEPLTGRKWEYTLFPISYGEALHHFGLVAVTQRLKDFMVYGMYPEVLNSPQNTEQVLRQLAGSYLYKDLLQYQGIRKPEVVDKLLLALALQLGNEVNYNELSRNLGIDRHTIETYINLLERAFVVFRVQPFNRNLRSEISTSRKIYFYDNGIRNAIIGNFTPLHLRNDVGALWENFVVTERIKALQYNHWYGRWYFWRTHTRQEIDWVEEKDGQLSAFEFKWNPKKASARLPKTFLDTYPIAKSGTITPDNLHDFLELR